MKLLFKPLGLLAGVLAGPIGGKVFRALWARIDRSDPPAPEHRRVRIGKLALALLLEGAVIALIRGLTLHGARRLFASLTGQWPGPEAPASSNG